MVKMSKRARVEGPARPQGHDYAGYMLGPEQGVGLGRYADISPDVFFLEYIAPRRPVVIEGSLSESEGWLAGKWSNDYLREKAGDAEVKVEWRASHDERFGRGQEKAMNFSEFLGELEKGSELLYLTTQDLGVDASGRPRVMAGPLDKLRGDFPLRPRLVGGLVPQNVNLWMGNSRGGKGSSSGLHHDFHDNLYVLLRGKKTFRLYSPADTHRMYLEGSVVKVHPNGRINYKGKETLADGADPLAETAARAASLVDRAALKAEELAAKVGGRGFNADASVESVAGASCGDEAGAAGSAGAAREGGEQGGEGSASYGGRGAGSVRSPEEEVEEAQAALERGDEGAAKRLALAEEELEKALEAVLDAECTAGGGFGDGDDSGEDSSDSDGGPGFFDGVNDNPTLEEFTRLGAAAAPQLIGSARRKDKRRREEGGGSANGDGDRGSDGGGLVNGAGIKHADLAAETREVNRVEDERCDGTRKSGMLIPAATESSSGEHAAEEDGYDGEPVGVKRFSSNKAAPSNFSKVDPSLPASELRERFPMFLEAEGCTVEVKAGQMLFLPAGWFHEVTSHASEDGHMAFNYWFHPPDAIESTTRKKSAGDAAMNPYTSSFWQNDWDARLKEDGGGLL